ncbi:MAG: hypothetical protein LCI00_32735 [Chloroflexi bacterium]|nr:hypothetical protein [Chloroflexota bacterium]
MHPIYLRFVSLSVALFTALLTLIHMQPYDDSEYRKVLLPDGCPAPCFMDIRPGITTVSEMQRILRRSGWISEIRMAPYARWIGVIWNEQAPAWFSNDNGGVGLLVAVNGRTVEEVHLTTSLPLAQVQLLLGKPSLRYVNVFRGMGGSHFTPVLNYAAAYPARAMLVAVSQTCDGMARLGPSSTDTVVRYYAAMDVQSDLLQDFEPSAQNRQTMIC